MEANFKVENPGEIQVTMKITMSIEDWTKLSEQLLASGIKNAWPASALFNSIVKAIARTTGVSHPEIDGPSF